MTQPHGAYSSGYCCVTVAALRPLKGRLLYNCLPDMNLLCRAFGLLINTELPIPGALPADDSAQDQKSPDLLVLYGGTQITEERGHSGPYRSGREGLLFEKTGVARFLCDWEGRCVHVEALCGVVPDLVAQYLIATALPAALWLRGALMLHAGAAVLPAWDGAVAVVGASGAGKSTLLQGLVRAGGQIVAEDSCCLRRQDTGIQASGLAGCLHLRATGEPLDAERSMFAVPPSQCRSSAVLKSIVLLEPGRAEEVFWKKMSAPEALVTLLRHRHRPRVPDLAGLSAGLLPKWGDVARAVPVYSWKFPRTSLSYFADGHIAAAFADFAAQDGGLGL